MRFQASVFSLHPEFLQVESQGKEEQFCPHIRFASGKETAESKPKGDVTSEKVLRHSICRKNPWCFG